MIRRFVTPIASSVRFRTYSIQTTAMALLLVLAASPAHSQSVLSQTTWGGFGADIADSVAAIRKMGAENGFDVEASDHPTVFADETLKKYKTIVFSNSNLCMER